MKKIKIFIGSSIDDLAYERRDLVSFIAELNNKFIDRGIYIEPYICEEKTNELRIDGSQKAHDAYIQNDADAMVFMFFKRAGKYTLRELEIAKEALYTKQKKSHIFIYFKTVNNEVADTREIKAAIDKIAGEYAHYYKTFSETDTIKLELLQYLSDTLEKDALTISNGKVYIGDIEANDIQLSNVFAFQNNAELTTLKEELAKIEMQMQVCVEERNWTLLKQLTDEHQKKQLQRSKLETRILEILQHLFKCLHEEKPNPIRIKALMLLEEGKHREALLLLPLTEITVKAETLQKKKALLDTNLKQEANEILQDGIARLRALALDINNPKADTETEKTYDSIVDVALIAGNSSILLEYVNFLESYNCIEKAVCITKIIEKNLDRFDDISIYTKYDVYNILSENSEAEETQKFYSALAKESLFSYIKNLDKSDWKNYVATCKLITDLFLDTKEILPYIVEAITIIERHPDDRSQSEALNSLLLTLGQYYFKVNDAISAESCFAKKATLAIAQSSGLNVKDLIEGLSEKAKGCADYKVPHTISLWRTRCVRAYEYLYKLNPAKYEDAYTEQLAILGLVELANNRYQESIKNICQAALLSGDNPKYKNIRRLAKAIGNN